METDRSVWFNESPRFNRTDTEWKLTTTFLKSLIVRFNRTDTEWKRSSILYSKSSCPIQSDRYGMETHTLDIVHCYQRFNRTDTEWKLEFLDKMDNPLPRFNRTDTEWKRALQSCNVRSLRIQSDRYGMETRYCGLAQPLFLIQSDRYGMETLPFLLLKLHK